jgi:hypothetical protein
VDLTFPKFAHEGAVRSDEFHRLAIAMMAGNSRLRMRSMSMIRTGAVLMMFAISGIWFGPAHAAPPTVTPSPGYDARLQEQRSAQIAHEPLDRNPPARHHGKRHHARTH